MNGKYTVIKGSKYHIIISEHKLVGVNKTCSNSEIAVNSSRTSVNCAEIDGGTCNHKPKDIIIASSIRECAAICNGITSGFTFGNKTELQIGYCDEHGCICHCEQINECYESNHTSVPLYQFLQPEKGSMTVSQISQSFV